MNIKNICNRIKNVFGKDRTRSENVCLENKLAEAFYVIGLMIGNELNEYKDNIDQRFEDMEKRITCHKSILEDTVNIEEQIAEELLCVKKELVNISERLTKLESIVLKNKLKGC